MPRRSGESHNAHGAAQNVEEEKRLHTNCKDDQHEGGPAS